jgi:flagellar biogenesis protein FliO
MESTTELIGGMLPSVLVIGLLLFGLRRLNRRPAAGRRTTGLRVVERTGVTRGGLVAVVETDGRRFLVGATEHGINLLSELPARPASADSEAIDLTTQRDTDVAPPIPDDRPWSGLVHRLQQMTVRTHVEAPLRELS